ncbi:MAG: ABC transporter permease [Chloroflexi bacterium]|nr:ABC transporter permease [Chloroflexota bacterium]
MARTTTVLARPERPLPVELGARLWAALKAMREAPKLPTFVLGSVLVCGILAPVFTRWGLSDPIDSSLINSLQPPVWQGGTWANWLGTDQLGRDVFARVIHGSRVSLVVGLFTVFFAGSIGTTVALLSGYFGGWVDVLLMRLTDSMLSMPFLLIAIVFAAVLGPSERNVILILAVFGWAGYARVLRSEVLRIKNLDYVSLARVAGASTPRILVRHIFPQIVNSLIVLATLQLGVVIIAEASLSFLGLGVPPPKPAWGSMLADGRGFLTTAWWMATFPGFGIMFTVLGTNLMGEWLRIKLDPKFRALR